MAKKAQATRPAPASAPVKPPTGWLFNPAVHGLIVAGLAIVLYANTLRHGFVLDDRLALTHNAFVERGWRGIPDIFSHDTFQGFYEGKMDVPVVAGGRYRPLSLALFALVHPFTGENAFVFHLLTVLLYALTCWGLYRVLLRFTRGAFAEAHAGALTAFFTAALFAAHPVHTEVVANIKGCDEILALLFGLGAWYAALRWQENRAIRWAVVAALSLLLACLSKESGLVFAGIVPLAVLIRQRFGQSVPAATGWWPIGAALAAGVAVYLALRGLAVGWQAHAAVITEPLNNPFMKLSGAQWVPFSGGEKAATIVYTLGRYLQLLIVPHPLTHDYYPQHIPVMSFSAPAVLLSVLAYAALLAVVALGLWRIVTGRASATLALVVLGVAIYLGGLVLVANLFFPIGTFMGERFLFLPSVGFCLSVAALGVGVVLRRYAGSPRWNGYALAVAFLVVLFSVRTVRRNPAWESNLRLFETDIAYSPNSAKLRNDLGTMYLGQASDLRQNPERMRPLLEKAFEHLSEAVHLHPTYRDPYLARGAAAFYLGRYDDAAASYRAASLLDPTDSKAKIGLAYSLRESARAKATSDPATALAHMLEAWQNSPQDREIVQWLADYYGRQPGQAAEAQRWAEALAKLK